MCSSIAYMIYLPKYKGTTVYHVPKYLYTLFCVRRDPVSVSQSLWVPSSSVVSMLVYVTTTTTVPTLAWLSPLKRTKFASSRKNVSRVYRKTSRGWLAPLLCWWSSSWSSLRPSLVMSSGTFNVPGTFQGRDLANCASMSIIKANLCLWKHPLILFSNPPNKNF